jgi:hypothetical protein
MGRLGRLMPPRVSRKPTSSADHRRFPRFSCSLPVELHIETPGHLSVLKAVARNISRGGMLIECATMPALKSACHVAFRVPDWVPFLVPDNLVLAEARVQHCDRNAMNFGLAFAQPL